MSMRRKELKEVLSNIKDKWLKVKGVTARKKSKTTSPGDINMFSLIIIPAVWHLVSFNQFALRLLITFLMKDQNAILNISFQGVSPGLIMLGG